MRQFVDYLGPVLEALKDLGGSARPGEVEDWLVASLDVPTEVLDAELASGGTRFRKWVHFARFYLAKAGLIDSSTRGVWRLTEQGRNTRLDYEGSMALCRELQSRYRKEKAPNIPIGTEDLSGVPELDEHQDHTAMALDLLKSLPPEGFERLCQRILRESGFQNVVITSRRDGGIDGHGVFRLNPFVGFCVYFQCKRHSSSIGAAVVRDFRGAITGRAGKGIIMTTSVFTGDAKKEATRDGAPPIDLVDGDMLINMLEELRLGMVPRTIFEIDEGFFVEYGHQLQGER